MCDAQIVYVDKSLRYAAVSVLADVGALVITWSICMIISTISPTELSAQLRYASSMGNPTKGKTQNVMSSKQISWSSGIT